eukprot:UN27089
MTRFVEARCISRTHRRFTAPNLSKEWKSALKSKSAQKVNKISLYIFNGSSHEHGEIFSLTSFGQKVHFSISEFIKTHHGRYFEVFAEHTSYQEL